METTTEKLILPHDLVEKVLKVYEPAYHCQNRYLLLMGGAGSGKSFFAAQKVLHRMRHSAGHRFVVVRKVEPDLLV